MTNATPYLSIIIPIYNSEEFISICIDSIINQTSDMWELILVDDGSTDNSGEICDSYAKNDYRINVIHTENHGASHARNIGIKQARGKWISFIDSDDWVSNKYVQTLIENEDNSDIVFFNVCITYPNGQQIIKKNPETVSQTKEQIEKTIMMLQYGNNDNVFGWTFSKFIKRSVIQNNNILFNERMTLHEDEDFTLKVCQNINSLKIIDHLLYHYQIREGSLTYKGFIAKDKLILADALETDTLNISYAPLIEKRLLRINELRIDYFLDHIDFNNFKKISYSLYKYFHRCPQSWGYTNHQDIVYIMNHRFWITCLQLYSILIIHKLLYLWTKVPTKYKALMR